MALKTFEVKRHLKKLFEESKGTWFSTSQLKTITGGEHVQVRAILKGMHEDGLISCRGVGSFKWMMPEDGQAVEKNDNVNNDDDEEIIETPESEYSLLDTRNYYRRKMNDTPKAFGFVTKDFTRIYISKKLSKTCTIHGKDYLAIPNWMAKKNGWTVVSPNLSGFLTEFDSGENAKPEDNSEAMKELVKKNESLTKLLEEVSTKLIQSTNDNEKLREKNKELEAETSGVKTIRVIYHKDGKKLVANIKDIILPKNFDKVKTLAECRRNILLVGPAGSGKTFMGKLVARLLKMEFGAISCTAGMSESNLLGRSVPNLQNGKNVFHTTQFLERYENGGVFLLDEFDAADANTSLCMNSAIANGYCPVPARTSAPVAERHKDFILIATANTFGRGANRMYAGRNQLDEATLDRFRIGIIETYYDPKIEAGIAPSDSGNDFDPSDKYSSKYVSETAAMLAGRGYHLRGTCQYVRHKIELGGIRRIMSTRFVEDAHVMMTKGKWSIQDVMETYLEGWTAEECAKLN